MYKKKKRINVKKILIICFIVIALIIGLVVNIFKTERKLTIFESAIKDSVVVVSKVISYPFNFISNQINESKEKNKMYENYKNMEQEINDNKIIQTENDELKKQIEEMKSLLQLNEILSDYDKVNATVIGRDLNYWFDTITIDKGENDGIIIGNPVIVSDGLIGKVVKTTSFTSTVRLLTAGNVNDKVSVKIKIDDDYVYGILSSYNKKNDTYIIEGISQTIEFKENLIVTTTGMGDIYPSGIKIGEVIGINTDNFDLANVLEVKSLVDFNNLSYVTVLKRSNK